MVGVKTEETVTPEELRELLRYDPETGLLTWLDRPLKFFHDNGGRYTAKSAQKIFKSLCAGKPALTAPNPAGYLRGNLFGRSLMSHRAAFCLMEGRWPTHQIDHINGFRDDNRWCNLREATNQQNQQNTRSAKGSSSKFVGVAWCKKAKKWTAYICPDGTKVHLGNFTSEEEAALVRDEAAKRMFGHYARLNLT